MKKKGKKIAIGFGALVFLALLGMGAYLMLSTEEEGESIVYDAFKVKRSTASRVMKFRGLLESAKNVPVLCMTRGRVIEMMEQGAEVKKGDVICQIDDTTPKGDLENQETNFQSSSLAVEQAEALQDLVTFQENNNYKMCQARLEHALLEEREELNKPDERECQLMDIEERLAELDVQDAEENYQREYRMFKKNYITASALEPYERKLENAKASLEELRIKNQITRKGATAERRVELRKAVERAQANLERVGLRRERRLNDIKSQLAAAKYGLSVVEFDIKRTQAEIAAAVIKAPESGVFLRHSYRDWRGGNVYRELKEGDERGRYDLVGHIIDPAVMNVKMVVNESDFPLLWEGMAVKVTFPAVPDKLFDGVLKHLGAVGKDRSNLDPMAKSSVDSEVTMFNATVEVKGDGTKFHPGMSAIISAETRKPLEGLFLPRQALVRKDDGSCFVYGGRGEDLKPVKGRDFNDMLFLVVSGLKEGERIYIPRNVAK